jgi:hypothetical protein
MNNQNAAAATEGMRMVIDAYSVGAIAINEMLVNTDTPCDEDTASVTTPRSTSPIDMPLQDTASVTTPRSISPIDMPLQDKECSHSTNGCIKLLSPLPVTRLSLEPILECHETVADYGLLQTDDDDTSDTPRREMGGHTVVIPTKPNELTLDLTSLMKYHKSVAPTQINNRAVRILFEISTMLIAAISTVFDLTINTPPPSFAIPDPVQYTEITASIAIRDAYEQLTTWYCNIYNSTLKLIQVNFIDAVSKWGLYGNCKITLSKLDVMLQAMYPRIANLREQCTAIIAEQTRMVNILVKHITKQYNNKFTQKNVDQFKISTDRIVVAIHAQSKMLDIAIPVAIHVIMEAK